MTLLHDPECKNDLFDDHFYSMGLTELSVSSSPRVYLRLG